LGYDFWQKRFGFLMGEHFLATFCDEWSEAIESNQSKRKTAFTSG